MTTSAQTTLPSSFDRRSIEPDGPSASELPVVADKSSKKVNRPFHVGMFWTCVVLLAIDVIGCKLTSVRVPGALMGALGFSVLFAAVFPLLAYWNEKQKLLYLDAALTICWVISIKVLLAYSIVIAARIGMRIALWDERLVRLDKMLGVNIAQLSAWASTHWIGQLANSSYVLLPSFIAAAALLAILTRRVVCTQKFLTANVIAFAVSLPIFAIMPAVGPWYGLHFTPSESQLACQSAFLLVRQPGPSLFGDAGIICFPSFHAVWAVLCSYPLWESRWLRIPAILLSSLILFSAVSTGWHYFIDILAGVLIAAVSILVANRLHRATGTAIESMTAKG